MSANRRLRTTLFTVFVVSCSAGVLLCGVLHVSLPVLAGAALTGAAAIFACGKFVLRHDGESISELIEKRYNLLESIPDAFFIVDREFRFSHINERTETILRRSAGELVGTRIQDLLDPLASELLPEMQSVRARGHAVDRVQYFSSTGTWIEIRITPAKDELLVYLRDVTERKRGEIASRDLERRLRLLLAQVPAVVWTVDLDLRITSVAGGGVNDQPLTAEQMIGQSYEVLISNPKNKAPCLEALNRAIAGEAVRYESSQNERWLQNDLEPMRSATGEIVGAIGIMLDITDVRASAERFAELARTDTMTGLPNRLALEERLPKLLERGVVNEDSVAVLFIDVDRFKTINDTLGHRTGDALLRSVATRLDRLLNTRATVYRSGGDEFVVTMEGIRHKRAVATLAMDVLSAFQESFTVDARELFVTVSVGASMFPQNARNADELIAFADSAMYRAKEAGRNNAKFYDGTMHAHVLERMGLEQDLRNAVSRGEIRLVYQPILDVSTQRIIAAEALARWQHPLLGELMPQTFIPIAEETGTIVEITRFVLREACRRAAYLRASEMPEFRIAVNLSPRDLYEPDFAAMVAGILRETGLSPNALDLEVTENVMLNESSVAALNQIAKLGVQIVVDDFGTGYSSLSYIKKLPVSAIKIDKSFIDEVAHNPFDQGIVKAISTLGETLKLLVTAEGIDSAAQWEFVRSLHCEQTQGFYFYRPAPWDDMLEHIRRSTLRIARPGGDVIPLYGVK